jgi:thiazole synthase
MEKYPDNDTLELLGENFNSRFLLGTAGYSSPKILLNSIFNSSTEIVTLGLKRQITYEKNKANIWVDVVKSSNCTILPNTAGCRTSKEAVVLAEMSRELFETNWVKLEVVGDEYTLQPDCFELLDATAKLSKMGFDVFAFCTEDIIVAKRLMNEGCKILMPWGSPIGSGQGLKNFENLIRMREKFPEVKLIIDAGIGAPSHASFAMELGFDAVLLNSAVSQSVNPENMALAFRYAIAAGRQAFEAGLIKPQNFATASTITGDAHFD